MQIPAATVAPASLIANLAICGFTDCFSITKLPIGFSLTIATSPFFIKSGFACATCPDLGSSLLTISTNWHGTCAVWTWNTGV